MIEEIKKDILVLIQSIEPFDTCCKSIMNVIEGMINQTLDKYKDKENDTFNMLLKRNLDLDDEIQELVYQIQELEYHFKNN